MRNVIELNNISKVFKIPHEKRNTLKEHAVRLFRKVKYEEFFALEDLSLSIKKGDFYGIIGRNGSGKSTLLKIIAGIFIPSSGSLEITGKIASFLELGVGFNPELTARENIFLYGTILGLSKEEINKKFNSIIEFAELENFIDAKLKTFSSGMQVRLGFATAIQSNADIYLVDEVLAVGDADFKRKCFDVFERFKDEGKTVVFVSHDLTAVEKFCNRIAWLDKKLLLEGNSQAVIEAYSKQYLYNETNNPDIPDPDSTNIPKRWGNNKAIITKVEFLGENGQEKQIFETGEKFTIRILFHSFEEINDPTFGIAIYNNNVLLLAPNTTDAKIETGKINSTGYVDFTTDSLPFLSGRYLVTVTLYNSEKTIAFDHQEMMHFFNIKGGKTKQFGFITLNEKWNIIKN